MGERKSWNDLPTPLLWALDSIRHSSGEDIFQMAAHFIVIAGVCR